MFDPNSFLDMQVAESNDTTIVPIPVGDYTAMIDTVGCKQWQKKDDPSVNGLKLSLTWTIDDANVKELLARDKVTSRQDIMLDLTEAGGLDMGKGRNVGLGKLREACGLNTPGQPFSFNMLTGRIAKIKIGHRIDGENIYAEVKGVAKLA